MAFTKADDFYKGVDNPWKSVSESLLKLDEQLQQISSKTAKEFGEKLDALSVSSDKFGDKLKQLNELEAQSAKAQKELALANNALEKAKQQELKTSQELEKVKQQENKTRKETANAIKAEEQAAKASIVTANAKTAAHKKATKQSEEESSKYKTLSNRLEKLRRDAKDVGAEYGIFSSKFKVAASSVKKLDNEIKAIDSELGLKQRNVGNYGSALDKLKGSVGMLSSSLIPMSLAIGAVGVAFKSTVTVFSSFEKQMSAVRAVSGATSEQYLNLKSNAQDLGESTQFTATQVAELQKEYSKLGFSASEIVKVTDGTLDLSIAAGTDLKDAAMVAGSTLRAFGLDVTETGRVTDVMASSFSSSALDIESFRESMKYVAPVAKSAGVSIEEASAMLSTLADNGIKGSQAGTSLRRILTDLANKGGDAKEELSKLSKTGLTLTDSMDEVGRTAQTALLVLSENEDQTNKLTKTYNNATGAAKDMAKAMADNLAGDTDKARSAIEGMQIALGDRLNPALRRSVSWFANLVSSVTDFIKIPVSQVLSDEQAKLNTLVGTLIRLNEVQNKTNASTTLRKDTIAELQKLYPDFLANIGSETENTELLKEQLRLVNEQYEKKIATRLLEEELEGVITKRIKDRIELVKTENAITDITKRLNDGERLRGLSISRHNLQRESISIQDRINKSYEDEAKIRSRFSGIVKEEAKDNDRIQNEKLKTAKEISVDLIKLADVEYASVVSSADIALKKEIEMLRKKYDLYRAISVDLIENEEDKLDEIGRLNEEEAAEYEKIMMRGKELHYNTEKSKTDTTLEQETNRGKIISASLSAVSTLTNSYFAQQDAASRARVDRQVALIQDRENAGLISARNSERQTQEIRKKSFEEDKKRQKAQAVINGALAVTRIIAEVPFGISAILIAAAIATTVAQVATIDAQEFADGSDSVQPENGIGGKKNKDDIPALLTRGEMVVPVSESEKLSAIGVGRYEVAAMAERGVKASRLMNEFNVSNSYNDISTERLEGIGNKQLAMQRKAMKKKQPVVVRAGRKTTKFHDNGRIETIRM